MVKVDGDQPKARKGDKKKRVGTGGMEADRRGRRIWNGESGLGERMESKREEKK